MFLHLLTVVVVTQALAVASEIFFWSCFSTFLTLYTSTISRFGERFRDGQYSLVSFLFAVLLLMVHPPYPAMCKSGEHVPSVPMESAPLMTECYI